jgi:hypothetical protein
MSAQWQLESSKKINVAGLRQIKRFATGSGLLLIFLFFASLTLLAGRTL